MQNFSDAREPNLLRLDQLLIVVLELILKSTCCGEEAPPLCAIIVHGRLLRNRADGPPSLHSRHARALRFYHRCCAILSS